MEFSVEKCAMLAMKSGKWHLTDEMELPNQDKIRTLGEEKNMYKYLGILEAAPSNTWRWKKKIIKNISGELKS